MNWSSKLIKTDVYIAINLNLVIKMFSKNMIRKKSRLNQSKWANPMVVPKWSGVNSIILSFRM